MIYILYLLFGIIGWMIYKHIYRRYGIIHPLIWIYLDGFLNYYWRSWAITHGAPSVIPGLIYNDIDVFIALLYVTIIFFERYLIYVNEKKISVEQDLKVFKPHLILYYCLSVAVILVLFYTIASGKAYTLGENFNAEQTGIIDQLFGELALFKYFVYFLGIYSYKISKRKSIIILSLILLLLIFAISVISTSKGQVVILFIVIAYTLSILKIRVNYAIVLPFVIVFVFLFAKYSYYVRYYGVVSGQFQISDLRGNLESFSDSNTDGDLIDLSLLQRYYYLDPIIYLENHSITDGDIYNYGSVRDLQGIIPRSIYYDKPHNLNYGMYTSKVIFGNGHIEEPIGRLAEMYSLIGFGGIFIYPIFIFIGAWLYRKYYLRGCVLKKSMYLCLLLTLLSSDSGWLTYLYRFFIESFVLLWLCEIFIRKKGSQVVCK